MQLDRPQKKLGPPSKHIPVVNGSYLAVLFAAVMALAAFLFLPAFLGSPLPDFRPLETQERKNKFFAFLDPIINEVSADVLEQREFVESVAARVADSNAVSWRERRRLTDLAEYYEVPLDGFDYETEVLPALQQRIDVVPRSLILIQAAKESGWGTSRFALQGNNLFGQRCYSPNCGLAPAGIENPNFNVATFGSVHGSVSSYVRNLNTHPQYAEFRRMRETLRRDGRTLSGMILADNLLDYSERGADYVAEIKAMIAQNALEPGD